LLNVIGLQFLKNKSVIH